MKLMSEIKRLLFLRAAILRRMNPNTKSAICNECGVEVTGTEVNDHLCFLGSQSILTQCNQVWETSPQSAEVQAAQERHNEQSGLWTHDAIYRLIEAWGQNKNKFTEAGRNTKAVWAKIAIEICTRQEVFEGHQCAEKWKSLKRTYKRIVDNNKSSGRGFQNWKYLDAMDGVMGNRPEIQPMSSASSISGFTVNVISDAYFDTEGVSSIEDNTNAIPAKRRRANTNQGWIAEFLDRQDRRHQENLAQRRESNLQISSLLEKIIEKL